MPISDYYDATVATRFLLILNGILLVVSGKSYFDGMADNRWPMFQELFVPQLNKQCSGGTAVTHMCWSALVPFYASQYVALGLCSILAAIAFRKREAALMLVAVGLTSVWWAWLRLNSVPSKLYQEGKATMPSTVQYTLGAVDTAAGGWLLNLLFQEEQEAGFTWSSYIAKQYESLTNLIPARFRTNTWKQAAMNVLLAFNGILEGLAGLVVMIRGGYPGRMTTDPYQILNARYHAGFMLGVATVGIYTLVRGMQLKNKPAEQDAIYYSAAISLLIVHFFAFFALYLAPWGDPTWVVPSLVGRAGWEAVITSVHTWQFAGFFAYLMDYHRVAVALGLLGIGDLIGFPVRNLINVALVIVNAVFALLSGSARSEIGPCTECQ